MSKTLKYHIVTIEDVGGFIKEYGVRHYDPRQARAWILEKKVTSRVATQDDMMRIAKDQLVVLEPFEPEESAQLDIVDAINAASSDDPPAGRVDKFMERVASEPLGY